MDAQSIPNTFLPEAGLEPLYGLISKSEDRLTHRMLECAESFSFSKDTSTLQASCRQSISDLAASLLAALKNKSCFMPSPDDNDSECPAASWGAAEARQYRKRGAGFEKSLGLMKSCRQGYLDLVRHAGFEQNYQAFCRLIVERFFDRVEIGFCAEWASAAQRRLAEERQEKETLQGVLKMAGAICHDLNQPLQVVSGISQLLTFDIETGSPLGEKINTIVDQIDKMGKITGRLQRTTRRET